MSHMNSHHHTKSYKAANCAHKSCTKSNFKKHNGSYKSQVPSSADSQSSP